MQQNLQDSLQDAISAHTMAADAKMLALQSQMNPHFLYNTLASISILAEDGENEQAVKMCVHCLFFCAICHPTLQWTWRSGRSWNIFVLIYI